MLTILVASTTLAWAADPDVLTRKVKAGTYEDLTIGDRVAISAMVLSNPARFQSVSIASAYEINSNDFSEEFLIGFLRASNAGTVAFAKRGDAGKYVIESKIVKDPKWLQKLDQCVPNSIALPADQKEECVTLARSWLAGYGVDDVLVTTDSDFSVGKPIGKVINWAAEQSVPMKTSIQ
jgi:hypothetical protein